MALIRLNTRSLPDNAVTTAKVADNAVTTTKLFADNLGRRNVLINGNFDVWQRATSFTDVAGIWKYGHADRWNGHNDAADAGTYSQSAVVPNAGSTYSMLLTGASGVSNTNFSQRIESTNLKGIREKDSFTVSGYARSAIAGKVIACHALCPTATDNYAGYTQHNGVMSSVTISGNGGTATSQITLTDANTSYYFTMTKTSATSLTNFDKGYALFLAINGQTSTSHQVYLSQLQVEAGTTATPFEQRSFGEELQLCQRYYMKETTTRSLYVYQDSNVYLRDNFYFPVEMRANPTVAVGTIHANAGSQSGSTSLSGLSKKGVIVGVDTTAVNGRFQYANLSAEAEL